MATANTNVEGGPVYFWRETEHPYGFLSQWYLSPFSAPSHPNAKPEEMVTFVTTEQYMMYGKAMVFGDKEIAAKIMTEPSPKKQKALGRKVKGFDNQTWNAHREKIVEEGNWWKFTSDKGQDMAKLLLETGERLLVEASPYDRIWGIGFSAAGAESHRAEWGENLLGKALMRVRSRLQREKESKAEAA